MSSVAHDVSARVKVSDPRPSHCSACFRGAEEGLKFIDFDAAVDRGTLLNSESLVLVESLDDLHLCESCVREAAQVLAFKPDLHARQLREIKRLEIEREHWRDTTKRLQAELSKQVDANMGAAA